MIFLLGARDTPVDGVEDYCRLLAAAITEAGRTANVERFPWAERGWLRAFAWLWRESRSWRGEWVVLQYTALQWSKHGMPIYLPTVFAMLRLRGVKRAVVFHDANPYPVRRPFDRIRKAIQVFLMKWLCRGADRVITTIDPKGVFWIANRDAKYVCIPVGANVPVADRSRLRPGSNGRKKVAVFSVTPGKSMVDEAKTIAQVVSTAAQRSGSLQLVVLGRNSKEAGSALQSSLDGGGVELRVLGLLPAEEVAAEIAACDALLFVREGVSSRRSSAIAGIMQGLPIVAYSGPETAFPITEAGLALAPEGNREALATALAQVVGDAELQRRLRARSEAAREKYFSWDSIANNYVDTLQLDR